ncbi:tetratricopeptide repeat protein [soil metagenome]
MPELTIQQALELALQHHQAGRLKEAEPIYRQILSNQPAHADALHLLGMLAHQVGQQAAAVELIRKAIGVAPNRPVFYTNLGHVMRSIGENAPAIEAFRRAAQLQPRDPQAHYNLANALKDSGQPLQSIPSYEKVLELKADSYEAFNNLGVALQDLGRTNDAIVAYQRSILIKPDLPIAYTNLAVSLKEAGQLGEAIAACRKAVALAPDFAQAHSNLSNLLREAGQGDEAIANARRAIELKPDYADAHSNLLLINTYRAGVDPAQLAADHRKWSQQHAEPLLQFIQPLQNNRDPDRKLRVGYVSSDFRDHVIARFMQPLLANHDHAQFEVYCYAQVGMPDKVTDRLRKHATVWRSLIGLSDTQAAELIRQDGIDLLIDLAGHTATNRLLVFARKPAPVQATYLGYPNTTGVGTIEYRITDAYADPPGMTEAFHSEQLVRLSPSAWCVEMSPAPSISPRYGGAIAFGCLNNYAKISDMVLVLWAEILTANPTASLILPAAEGINREHTLAVLGRQNISADRVQFVPKQSTRQKYLESYAQIDIALDAYPYHGTATTCDALWMGVPVVTLAGPSHVSRVGVSLLNNVGLADLVADTPADYVRIAGELAGDLPRLKTLRTTLRDTMKASPLMDGKNFAKGIEAAYRRMWHKWCDAQAK